MSVADLLADPVLFLVQLTLLALRDVAVVVRGVKPFLVADATILAVKVSCLRRSNLAIAPFVCDPRALPAEAKPVGIERQACGSRRTQRQRPGEKGRNA